MTNIITFFLEIIGYPPFPGFKPSVLTNFIFGVAPRTYIIAENENFVNDKISGENNA